MTQIVFPTGTESERTPGFYLAAEEYVAGTDSSDEAVFFWKVRPAVIFGRNQQMSAEVNLSWCMEHGVQVFRRRSGGGCVYADSGNLMVSYISPGVDVRSAFAKYLSMMTGALRKLGVEAEPSGNNDIVAYGRKISGNAFYTVAGKSIVHGTLLYDSDLDAMLSAITPSAEKLEKHGVASVRQRVANIRPMLGEKAAREGVADMSSLMSWLAGYLCDTVLPLPEQAMSRIGIISGRYLDRDFIENGRHSSRPSGQRPDSRI